MQFLTIKTGFIFQQHDSPNYFYRITELKPIFFTFFFFFNNTIRLKSVFWFQYDFCFHGLIFFVENLFDSTPQTFECDWIILISRRSLQLFFSNRLGGCFLSMFSFNAASTFIKFFRISCNSLFLIGFEKFSQLIGEFSSGKTEEMQKLQALQNFRAQA